MAISRVTSQDALGTSTTTSVAATYPATPTSGNLLIASVTANVTKTSVNISGWTAIEGDMSGTAQMVGLYWKISAGSEGTITATGTAASQMRIHIYEYTGNDASPFDQSNTATSGTTSVTSLASGSITTTQADELIFIAGGTAGSTSSHSYDSSFDLRQTDASNIRLFDGDRIVSSTGTYSTTGSWTSSVRGASVIASFKAQTSSANTSAFFSMF